MDIGFIGAGTHARKHMAFVREMQGTRIAGIADPAREAAEAAAATFGGQAYTDSTAMLDTERPDAVFFSIPPSAHGVPERALIERGIPFLVEKPVALDAATARELEQAITARGLIVATGYQWRYMDLVERIQAECLNTPVYLVQGYWLSTRPKLAWWHDPARSGEQITEQATHMIDLTRLFLGEARSVHAVMSPPAEDSAVPAATAVTLRFDSGIPATIICGCAGPVRYRTAFVVHTAQAVYELNSTASGMMNLELLIRRDGGEERILPAFDCIQRQDEAFLKAVRSGDATMIRSDYANGVRSLDLSLAARASRDAGRSVEVAYEK